MSSREALRVDIRVYLLQDRWTGHLVLASPEHLMLVWSSPDKSSSRSILVNSLAAVSASYHLDIALQLADARSLALGGAHVSQVVDGDGRTDAVVSLSDCRGSQTRTINSETLIYSFSANGGPTDRCAPRQTLSRWGCGGAGSSALKDSDLSGSLWPRHLQTHQLQQECFCLIFMVNLFNKNDHKWRRLYHVWATSNESFKTIFRPTECSS